MQCFSGKMDLFLSESNGLPVISVYPNPFSNQFTLNYFLPSTTTTSIYLINILGEKIGSVSKEILQNKGSHQLVISTDHLVAGSYFIVLRNGDITSVRQVIRL